MNKHIFKIIAVLAVSVLVVSCGKDKPVTSESNVVSTASDGNLYKIDTANSKIEWKGYKVLKSDQTTHFGTVLFESGDVTVKDGALQSGKFVANISTLENVDLGDDVAMKSKLESHLKSADFFDAEKFPTTTFEITKISKNTIGDYNTVLDGNLTIKGITKPVQFNANVSINEDLITIATEPKDINREDFGLKFEIPLENGLLNKEINLQILIKAMESK